MAPRAQAAPASADEGGPAGGPRAGARSRSPAKEPSEWALLQALDAKKLADEVAAKKAAEAKSKEEARLRLEAGIREKQAAQQRAAAEKKADGATLDVKAAEFREEVRHALGSERALLVLTCHAPPAGAAKSRGAPRVRGQNP